MDGTASRSTKVPAATGVSVVVVIALGLRVAFDLFVAPIGDEAYYWLWGQRPALSYFDHPPLHSWLLGLASPLGWNTLVLRLTAWLTFAGTLALAARLALRINPELGSRAGWLAVAICITSPVWFIMTTLAFQDHLMILFSMLAGYVFVDIFATTLAGDRPRAARYYLGGAAIGLAVLSKENGVFIAVAIAAAILATRALWPLLRVPHLYLAAILALLLQLPVLMWNISNDFASYRFNLVDRVDWLDNVNLSRPAIFIVLATLTFSPFALAGVVSLVRRNPGLPPLGQALRLLALWLFAASSLGMLVLSLSTFVLYYWNIAAYVLVLPAIAALRPGWRLFWPHVAYGLLITALIVVNYAAVPLSAFVGKPDWESSVVYGWDDVADSVRALRSADAPDFLAGTRYTLASQLGFALQTAEVTDLSERHSQFSFWFDPKAHLGQSALVLSDEAFPVDGVAKRFTGGCVEAGRVDVERFGIPVHRFLISRCTGFAG